MAVTINSNVAALNALRRLGVSSSALSRSQERLSSGLRINRPSDDAAGLAIASDLNVSSRVFNRGLKNANDGIGLLNVAEGSLTELSSVLVRIRELASQAANGTLSNTQRFSLDSEAQALRDEYNRIIGSTRFNGLSIHSADQSQTRIQMGYGTNGGIGFTLGDELARNVATGLHDSTSDGSAAGAGTGGVVLADVNNDGKLDSISGDAATNRVYIALGDGSGGLNPPTFVMLTGATTVTSVAAGDLNNDGKIDLVVGAADGEAYSFLGSGTGLFVGGVSKVLSTAGPVNDLKLADFNNDGNLDLVAAVSTAVAGYGAAAFGAGNGTFGNVGVISGGGITSAGQVGTGDFNGDGNVDVAFTHGGAGLVLVHLGTGTTAFAPTFGAQISNPGIGVGQGLVIGDFNGDGLDDYAVSRVTQLRNYLGNGSGNFALQSTMTTGTAITDLAVADLDGDGYDDIVTTGNGNTNTFFANNNGSLDTARLSANLVVSNHMALGDLNGDGVVDLALGQANVATFLFDIGHKTTLEAFRLTTQSRARDAFSVIDAAMQRISDELGVIGAASSRISSGINALSQAAEDYQTSVSRIMDADVADESATLLKSQILQQAGSAILGQANLLPSLALLLLDFNGPGRR